MKKQLIAAMVNKFLGMTLPHDFSPDGGVSFNLAPDQPWPTGTNLLTAKQARATFEYLLADVSLPDASISSVDWMTSVIRCVAELPDRNSPEDWPEAMLVTVEELRMILEREAQGTVEKLIAVARAAWHAAERR